MATIKGYQKYRFVLLLAVCTGLLLCLTGCEVSNDEATKQAELIALTAGASC
ncbi:MAG: hypothetical protein K5770_10045 [Lachnospiraceae bacterium]|nr:hypothetical protein [Lachnospiraceae bacterium]